MRVIASPEPSPVRQPLGCGNLRIEGKRTYKAPPKKAPKKHTKNVGHCEPRA